MAIRGVTSEQLLHNPKLALKLQKKPQHTCVHSSKPLLSLPVIDVDPPNSLEVTSGNLGNKPQANVRRKEPVPAESELLQKAVTPYMDGHG